MGLGDLIKGNNKTKLPPSKINEVTALKYLMIGAEFIVTLPITQLVRTSNGHGLSVRVGFYRQTFYSPPKTEMRFRKVRAIVVYDPEGITIKHAMPNGQHVVVNPKAIASVTKYTDGVAAELNDGTRYVFAMDKAIQNEWKKLGFDPMMPINVFYNILHGRLPKALQERFDKEAEIERKEAEKQAFQQAMIERHKEMDKRAEENRIRRAREQQQQREREEQEKLERQQQKEREEQEKLERQQQRERKEQELLEKQQELSLKENKKIFDEFKEKIKTLKETRDLEAITQEEYEEIKSNFINELISTPIPEGTNPLLIIKESKELLDIEAINQEEFDNIKSKFLKHI